MRMEDLKFISVHAWEYVNVSVAYPRRTIEAGGMGFEFYPHDMQASEAFKRGKARDLKTDPANVADFYFMVSVPKHFTVRAITEAIDAKLSERCATTKHRRVGANVLLYWKRNKMQMGGAKRPSTKKAA